MQIIVMGNPENRRVALFLGAARQWQLPPPRIISYLDLLEGKMEWADFLQPNTLIRIESPGENFEVEKALIALGANVEKTGGTSQRISAPDARQLAYDPGRVRFLRQWYLGYERLLLELKSVAETTRSVTWMNSPDAIRLMFDKRRCQAHLSAAGIAVPRYDLNITSYEMLRRGLHQRVFIKPSHSSSASGVIAYRRHGQREEAITTVERVAGSGPTRFYNSLKLQRYTSSAEIAEVVNFILNEGAIVEEWIPKASLQNQTFDVRIVVIGGKARHVVPRLSAGPITNLHLGNCRGDAGQLIRLLGEEKYAQLLDTAERSVDSLPGAFYAGVDVLIPLGLGQPRVLELNAFGDLLPNLYHHGEDTYTAELKALLHATVR
jgi:glutathione synthase/RimK-type ligase-like ATP-grasp enzyme